MSPSSAKAKIIAPEKVLPLQNAGMEYRAPNNPPGGEIEIWDLKTNELVKTVQVYEVKIKAGLETDVQWQFITKLSLSPNKEYLKVEKAGETVYLYNFKSGEVKPLAMGLSKTSWWKSFWQ